MKIRTDFVTNSSSSSFILAFQDKEDGISKIQALVDDYGKRYIEVLLEDFINTPPIRKEELRDKFLDCVESDAILDMSFGDGCWWSWDKPTFKNKWMKDHPNASNSDYYNSAEYKEELARRTDEIFDEISEKIGSLCYIVELEYEDHCDIGSELEQEILPNCDFTVRGFNHH